MSLLIISFLGLFSHPNIGILLELFSTQGQQSTAYENPAEIRDNITQTNTTTNPVNKV